MIGWINDLSRLSRLTQGYHQSYRSGSRCESRSEGNAVQQFTATRMVAPALVASLLCLALVEGGWKIGGLATMIFFLKFLHQRSKARRRMEAFDRDYPAFLLAVASSVKSGVDPFEAIVQSGSLFSEGSEIRRAAGGFVQLVETCDTEEIAIRHFAETIPHPDLPLFHSAMILSRRHGSSLGESLHRLARVTRQRQSFRRKVRAAVAMQRLSAIVIGGIAVLIAVFHWVSRPEGFRDAMSHEWGGYILGGGSLLILVGLTWMYLLSERGIREV